MSQENQEQQEPSVKEKIITLKIKLPEVEDKLEIPCSVTDTLYEIKETLKILPSSSEYTSYELKLNGIAYGEQTIISDLIQNDEDYLSMSLVPSPYNEITARQHVIATREYAGLESSNSTILEVSGVCSGASSYDDLELYETKPDAGDVEQKKQESETKKDENSEASDDTDLTVSEEEKEELLTLATEILEGEPALDIVAAKPTFKPSPALRSLYISQWSPADISRKLAGDLFYLQVQTLEGEIFNITSHVSGFFVNNCSNTKFDSSVHFLNAGRESKNYSLISLLKSLSPMFSKKIEENTFELSKHSFETYIVPTTTAISSPWLIKELETPTPDLGRSQRTLLHGGLDGSDLQVDWNKDYQLVKDMQTENLAEKLSKEQSLVSTSANFTTAAIKGAMAVIRGEISPVNPEEESDYHIYLRNGIFYSKAIDAIGQFNTEGGAEAARSTVGKDITGIKYLNKYDIKGVHSLLTTVVDYLGHRIVCQAPVPGILQDNISEDSEPPQSVKYGFIDDHADAVSDESFVNLFKEVGDAFHLKPHKIWNLDGSKVVDVVTSGYTKGTNGSDDKKYIIDLFRTTPLDIEFIEENFDLSKDNSYPHRETLLRHEAVLEWIKRETAVAVKKETERLEKEGKPSSEIKETIGIDNSMFLLNPDAFSLTPAPTPELAEQLKADELKVREVSKFVNQILIPEFIKEMEKAEVYNAINGTHLCALLHEAGINIRYLGKIAQLALERKAEYSKEKEAKAANIEKINKEVAEKEEREATERREKIEARIKAQKEAKEKGEEIPDFKEEEETEAKERAKAESELENKLNTVPVAALLDSLYELSVCEMISRATKHFLRKELESVPSPLAPYVISHIHNCLLAGAFNPQPEAPKLDSLLVDIYKHVDLSILERDAKFVVDSIAKEVFVRYRFNLPENWTEIVKADQLLKSIATKFGIQWKNKRYALTKEALDLQVAQQKVAVEAASSTSSLKHEDKHSKKKGRKSSPKGVEIKTEAEIVTTTFVPTDIVCIVPIVKNSIYESNSVPEAWETGIMKLSSEDEAQIQEGSIFINQAVQFCERIYGPINNITASYFSKLANMYANSDSVSDSVTLLKKSFQIFERCSGIDSYQAALSLNQLGNILLTNKEVVNSVKVFKRLLQYWTLSFGETHPNVINLLTSVAVIFMRLSLFVESTKIFKKTLALSDKVNGELSEQSSFFRIQISQLLASDKKYKEALEFAEKAFEGYKLTLGLNDKSTVNARKWIFSLKNYNEYVKYQAKNSQAREQLERKLEQEENIKAKQAHKARQVTPDPEISNKSIDDIVAFIDGPSNSTQKKKKHNKKKNSKK